MEFRGNATPTAANARDFGWELMPGSRCIASSFGDHKRVSRPVRIAPNAQSSEDLELIERTNLA
jgi:hypothetical protein